MKLLTTVATIAIILVPTQVHAKDAVLKACTGTQLAMLSGGIQSYDAFLAGMDRCRDAALDRLNNGIKDTDNPEALKEAQALQAQVEAIGENQGESETKTFTTDSGSEVLLPWN
ncbi:MAG: hypothetical protein ACRDBG_16100 [Waterburya sp.]